MADPDAIASRAAEMAGALLKSGSQEIAEMAGGDMGILREAARILQKRAETQTKPALGVEHIAFGLITAAYDSLRDEDTAG